MEDKKNSIGQYSEHDSFWDIESIVPPRRKSTPSHSAHTEPVDIVIPAKADENSQNTSPEVIENRSGEVRRIVRVRGEDKETSSPPECQYEPEISLIHKVRVYPWGSSYNYYESFVRMAHFYDDKIGECCEAVEFFSYMPQYAQMNNSQLQYYLYIREQIKNGIYPDIDYTYLLLLIYETINLADKKSFEYSVDLLSRIWMNYGRKHPRLDSQLSEWIFDLCLIGNLKPPYDIIGDIVDRLPASAALREFYVNASIDADGYAAFLMKYCSNYNYKKSKFAVGENLPLYEKHTKGVLAYILSRINDPSHPFELGGLRFQDSKTTRDSFVGALCSAKMKKRIEIEYCSFSHSHELRFVVSDLLKYAENRIRAHIGVKSRLSFGSLSPKLKALADEYFDINLPRKVVISRTDEAVAEYERLYEPRESTLTFSAARLIEESSWSTTDRLVEAFLIENDDEDEIEVLAFATPSGDDSGLSEDDIADEFINAMCDYQFDFLVSAIENQAEGQRQIASDRFMTKDVIADEINSISADILGDIVLEEQGDLFLVIEEYFDTLHRAITKRKGE